ncbi:DUF3631 domain-containing protein [Sphaerisporangium sp. B11E5]|uniref:DUF3631 domain-containing protein n=1 Tax=Sphaerisporangium sp. B11E5 TaxID=3153563 RepID=UPI00325DC378
MTLRVVGQQSGAELLDELKSALQRYIILPSDEAGDAITLWIAATHAVPAWEIATRLFISSPQKRCGKSRLLDIIEATAHDALVTVNISPAALVRSIGEDPPTLMLDEADTVFGPKAAGDHEDLRGLINAGFQRNRPYIRWDATIRKPEVCPTFAMVALAGIGNMPDTIMDRAVVVRMRRRAPGETVKPYRTRRDGPPLNNLRDRLHVWVRSRLKDLENAEPDMPVEDRAADAWESLIAVADTAGGEWSKRARAAAKAFVERDQQADASASVSLRLLTDLRAVFGDERYLYTTTILDRLHKIDESPWADYYGRPFGPRDLSKLLTAYEVESKNVRESGGPPKKGYSADDLWDSWSRYISRQGERYKGYKSDDAGQAGSGENPVADASATGQSSATALTWEVADVAHVAHIPPKPRPKPPEQWPNSCVECKGMLDPAAVKAGHTKHRGCE